MGSHRVHGGWHPPCCRERSRHKSEQRPRHLYRTRDKSCSLPLHVLSLSRWPNLRLCNLPEITNLRIERALEGRPRGAAFDIRYEALLACDDVGVLQDSQHSRHRHMQCNKPGVPWRDLPARFGDWNIVYQRFNRWAKSGVFDRIFKLLASDADNEYMMIDASIVRAHQHSAGARKKTARKRSADRAAD